MDIFLLLLLILLNGLLAMSEIAVVSARKSRLQKLADDARFNRFHAKVLLWCLLILIIDGYDIAVVGIAMPSIMQQMGVNASTAGFMASSA